MSCRAVFERLMGRILDSWTMTNDHVAPVVAGLATGIAFVVMFSILFQPSLAGLDESVIIIPRGASLESSRVTFEPQIVIVTIGHNNVVRWVNNDDVPHFIMASRDDSKFYDATQNSAGLLAAGQHFTFTFDEPGEYVYHVKPWLSGKVIVLPER
jgi:plastocyanin